MPPPETTDERQKRRREILLFVIFASLIVALIGVMAFIENYGEVQMGDTAHVQDQADN